MSQALAERVARERNVSLPIVMATIEAESNFRNIIGQYAAWSARFGIGFGQVHLRWHFSTLQQVARELGVTLPSNVNPMHNDAANEPFRRLLLGNDLLSMHLAVAVIGRKWAASGGNWDRFTEAYVGAGISDRDRERRRIIWNRWLAHYGHRPPAGGRQEEPMPIAAPAPVRAQELRLVDAFAGYGAIFLVIVAMIGVFRRVTGVFR